MGIIVFSQKLDVMFWLYQSDHIPERKIFILHSSLAYAKRRNIKPFIFVDQCV